MTKFLKRHPEITKLRPSNTPTGQTLVKPEHIANWLREIPININEYQHMEGLLSDPRRIFNCDETGFAMEGQTGRVQILALRGSKRVKKEKVGTKQQITVMFCTLERA